MTFNDLAKELNLSTATISRALSRPRIVAPETRTRVLDAVRRSGYQMNGIARSLRTQSTHTIGVIVSDGLPNIDTVILNNELGASLGTRHLVKLGHKRIAIVSGPQHLSNRSSGRTTPQAVVFEPELIVRRSAAAPKN